jgi:hypothetical protein
MSEWKLNQIQNLTQVVSENTQMLVRHSHDLEQSNMVIVECTGRVAESLEKLDLGGEYRTENSDYHPNVRVFEGDPKKFENWVRELEKTKFF